MSANAQLVQRNSVLLLGYQCARRFVFVLLLAVGLASAQSSYKYIRVGNEADVTRKVTPGYALMGGGADLDEAFQFLCAKGMGGDFLVLRAAGDDDYNSYINSLCKMNSVATLIVPSRDAANDSMVVDIVRRAEVLFIAGGDQARYINWWQHTALSDQLNDDIAEGKPVGGTSAGLAVLGEFIYSAQGDAPDDANLFSEQALKDPYSHRVALQRDFLTISLLHNILTDSHFAKRDRMGRSLAFLARIVQDGWSSHPREIAVDEKSAVLLESDGQGRVIGPGAGAYFLEARTKPTTCRSGTPLTFHGIAVYHALPGTAFDSGKWNGSAGSSYSLSVDAGVVSSNQSNGKVY